MAAVILLYPSNPALRRADGLCGAVVDAADATAAKAAARAMLKGATPTDFNDWTAVTLAATAAGTFKPFFMQGDTIVGKPGSGLPTFQRGGSIVTK